MAIDRLSPGDRLMLAASDIWPQEIGALAVLDGRGLWTPGGCLRIEELREWIAARVSGVPRLRQVVRRPGFGLGAPLWVDATHFEIEEHVLVAEVEAPGGEAELLACAEQLRRRPLDPTRSGWELWFLTGLPDGRVALYAKIHHAVADGLAAMTIISTLLDSAPDTPPDPAPAAWRPRPAPRPAALLADVLIGWLQGVRAVLATLLRPVAALRRLRAAMPAARELLAGEPPPATSLGRVIGQDRRLAVMRCELSEVRSIARAHGATVNDVLLALTAGGLRALMRHRGELVDGLWASIYVPITTRHRWRGAVAGNRVAQMAVPLLLGTADPVARLGRIAAETAERKTRDRSAVGKLFRSRIITWLTLQAANRQRVHACSANVPGPRRPLYLAGSRVLEVVPILPLIGQVAIGVGAITYAGGMCIGITADRDGFPDLDVLVDGMKQELRALRGPVNSHL